MSVIPTKPVERIQFYEDHIAPFTTNAVAIGITVIEAGDLETKTEAARAAFSAQQVALQSAKVATEVFHNAVESMSVLGAALIEKIRAKGKATGNPDVYTLSAIPAPAAPQPKGAPGKPKELTATVEGNGALTLAWRCANPAGSQGTLYQIWRKLENEADYQYLGGVGAKKFTDSTIPAGASQLMYQIQAVRSTAVGPWETFVVLLGTSGSGAMSASVVTPPKIAA